MWLEEKKISKVGKVVLPMAPLGTLKKSKERKREGLY